MTVVPPPPADLADMHMEPISRGTELHRFHHRGYAGHAFNPGLGRRTRFHPLRDASGKAVPTLYAGETLRVSAYEYVFHDIPVEAPTKTVAASSLDEVAYSVVMTLRTLNLVTLFEPDLNRWNTTRSQLIDTLPVTYADTVRWAEAIHRTHPHADGLMWTSRRADQERAFQLFGDRVAGDLATDRTEFIGGDPAWLARLSELGRRSGIKFVT